MWVVMSAAVVVLGHLATRTGGPLVALAASRPAVWVGERSYGLYLFHVLVPWPPSFARLGSTTPDVGETTFGR